VIIKNIFSCFYSYILDLLAPPVCAYCRVSLHDQAAILCSDCTARITPISSTYLVGTGMGPSGIKVLCITDYTDPLRKLILAKGHKSRRAARQLGELIVRYSYILEQDFDYIVPVPLHWTRYAQRGFNQATEISYIISAYSNKPVIELVKRVKKTQFQAECAQSERINNVKNAFELDQIVFKKNPEFYHGKKILLVDDLLTTGSTLRATAQVLAQLKPELLTAVVACRVA